MGDRRTVTPRWAWAPDLRWRSAIAVALALVGGACSDSGGTPSGPGSRIESLGIAFIPEEEHFLGVDAVTQMILRHYGQEVPQCEIADFGSGSCCQQPAPDCGGHGGGFLVIEHFLRQKGIESTHRIGTVHWEDVKAEIRAGRPIAVGYRDSFPGHAALIYGFRDDRTLLLHDPHYGSFEVRWDFTLGYAPDTRWVESLYNVTP